jgi:glycosyltransferase involved in cell wall biosynthesis
MKVLVSAIACHPRQGSEAGVGWKTVAALRRKHDLHVLTSAANKEAIESAVGSDNLSGISFTFFGSRAPYHENRLVARFQSWLRYLNWIEESQRVAAQLHTRCGFDLVHHVTYSSWRVPSPLWSLGIPLVWGPVGGIAEFPVHLLGSLSATSASFELLRNAMNWQSFRSGSLRKCLCKASAIVCSNRETFAALQRVRGNADGMYILSPTFFTSDQMAFFRLDAAAKDPAVPLRCFAGGNMIGSKGLIFALDAITLAKQRGADIRLLIASGGPEIPYLKNAVRRMGLESNVEFHSGFSGAAYREQLHLAHVFLLPSFRENAPGTILEAMLAGCVPVIVDASAQGDIVNEDCGFKVPIRSACEISEGIAEALMQVYRNPELRIRKGRASSQLIGSRFNAESYVEAMDMIYKHARGLTDAVA